MIKNEEEFKKFLIFLYITYRKIEMKMEKVNYPHILRELPSGEKSFVSVSTQLMATKKAFQTVDKSDFLKMYPVLKKLFSSYMDYIRCSMDNGSNIDEGNFLPVTVDEMKSWLEKLNTWLPMKLNGGWIGCAERSIITPPGFEKIVQRILEIEKFKTYPIITDESEVEPYIKEGNQKRFFGLVNMEETQNSNLPLDSLEIFQSECPEACETVVRKWICTRCGEFVRQQNMILYCFCGAKKYRDKLLTCHHPKHQPQDAGRAKMSECISPPVMNRYLESQPINEDIVPPVPKRRFGSKPVNEEIIPPIPKRGLRSKLEDKDISPPVIIKNPESNQSTANDEILSTICQQLEKIKIRKRESADPKILIALADLLSKNTKQDEIKDILKRLQGVETLDEDTKYLIVQYLTR